MFPDPKVSGRYAPAWLYTNLAEIYKKWLPDEDQQRTLQDGGYYSVNLLRHSSTPQTKFGSAHSLPTQN
jgi:hypothetical protein